MPQPLEGEEVISGELGSFVNKYHTFIRDALKSGTVDTVDGVIRDVCTRGQKTFSLYTSHFLPEVYTNYRMVLSFLNRLVKPECNSKSSDLFSNIDRLVAELELLMADDPVFEEFRNATV